MGSEGERVDVVKTARQSNYQFRNKFLTAYQMNIISVFLFLKKFELTMADSAFFILFILSKKMYKCCFFNIIRNNFAN